MIELSKLSETEVGRWVEYRDKFDSKPDRGRIRSWNERWIFVVYRCGGNWDEYTKYTGVATDPGDLCFVNETKEEAKQVMAGQAESFAKPIEEGWCRCYEDPEVSGRVVWFPMKGDPQVVKDKEAEIERLKEENAHFAWRDADKNRLITELCDALESLIDWKVKPLRGDLLQRAREATK